MDFLPSGSPSVRPFRYKVVQMKSPVIEAPRKSPSSRSSLAPFSYRIVSDRPSTTPQEISEFSSNVASSEDDGALVLPEFEKSDIQEPVVEAPSLSKIAKTAAVQALMIQTRADPSLKPACDRIYTRFFQSFSEWSLKNMRKKRRNEPEMNIDERKIAAARHALEDLCEEGERWQAAESRFDYGIGQHAIAEIEEPKVNLDDIETMINSLDKAKRTTGKCMAQTMEMDNLGQDIAKEMYEALA